MNKHLLAGIFIILAGAGASEAAERYTRVGVAFLGTGLVSFTVERHIGDASVRLNIGIFEPKEVCAAVSVNGYAGGGDVRPYAGIGVWNILIAPKGKIGALHFLNVPVGVDTRFGNGHALGAEVDFNYFVTGLNPGGGPVSFNKERRFLPLPGVYYKIPAVNIVIQWKMFMI